MKRLTILMLAAVWFLCAGTEVMGQGNAVIIPSNGPPSGGCAFMQLANDVTNGNLYFCNPSGRWAEVAGGGGTQTYTVTLTSPQLLEASQTDVLASVAATAPCPAPYAAQTCSQFTGVFPNGAGNALVGGVYTVTGFATHTCNNVVGALARGSSATALYLVNTTCAADTAVASAANNGFLFPATPPSLTWWNVERGIGQFNPNTTPYTIGSSDCLFNIQYLTALVNGDDPNTDLLFIATGLVDQTVKTIQPEVNTATFSSSNGILLDNANLPVSDVQDSLLYVSLYGTTPALTAGDGTLTIQLTLVAIPVLQ